MAKTKKIYVDCKISSDKNLLEILEADGWHIKCSKSGFGGAFVTQSNYVVQKEERTFSIGAFQVYSSITYALSNSKSNIKLLEKYELSYSETNPWDEDE